MTQENGNRLWNVRDLATFLATSAHAVYKLVERRQVPFVRLGRKILFDPDIIRTWINQHAVTPEQNPAIRG